MRNHHQVHARHHRVGTHSTREAQKGMTLLEIMIVVAILGMLATVVVTNLMGSLDNAKINTTKTKIAQVESSVKQYYLDFQEYPDSMKDLINPGQGRPPYVKKAPKDSWNRELIYKRSSGDKPFVIYSMGVDGQKGNKDDVYSDEDAKR